MPNPITGQPWPWEPQPPKAAPDNSAQQAVRDSLEAANGGLLGDPSPVTVMGTGAQANTPLNTGYSLYTFQNGASIEINDQGQSRNYKAPPASSTSAQAPANVAAKSGQLIMPNGQVYVKNTDTTPGAPPYVLDTNSQNNQQIETAKSVAATNLSQAQANSASIDAALKADPTNVALQQAKDAATAKLSSAQADAATLNAASTAQNAQSTAARVGAQNQLDSAQAGAATSNAASTAQNAQSTAARVLAQNQLDMAQAGAATTTAQNATNRLPSQIALDTAQANSQNAAATAALAKANEPTQWTPSTTAPTTQYYDPTTGQVVSQPNANYLPTDPGRMTAQLKQQADNQWQQLQQKVQSGTISGDQAASQFDQYWNENIEPVKTDIANAQAKAQSAIDLSQAQTANYQMTTAMQPATLAQNASSDAQKNLISMLPYVVGAGAATNPGVTPGKGGFPQINTNQIMQNATYSLPNLQEIGRQGAAAALANVSPTAAMHAQIPGPVGQPPVQGLPDVNSMLNMSGYGFGPGGSPGGAPMAPAAGPPGAPPPAAPPAAPPGAPAAPVDWNALQARQQQSTNEQALQAQISMPGQPAPPAAPPMMPPPPGFPPVGGAPGAVDWNALWARQQQDAANQQLQAQIPWGQYTPAAMQ
jgi:hypothetical protein